MLDFVANSDGWIVGTGTPNIPLGVKVTGFPRSNKLWPTGFGFNVNCDVAPGAANKGVDWKSSDFFAASRLPTSVEFLMKVVGVYGAEKTDCRRG